MGKKPNQQLDSSNRLSFSWDYKNILEALEPFLAAVENGHLSSQEFHFKLVTKNYQLKAGRLNPRETPVEDLREELDMLLRDVENGRMTTKEFRLEIDTELFQIRVGSYLDEVSDSNDLRDPDEEIERLRLTTYVFITITFICNEAWPLVSRVLCGTSINLTDIDRTRALHWKAALLPLLPLMLLSQPASGSMAYEMGEPLTVNEGDTGAIRFNDIQQNTDQSCDYVYVTIRFEGFNHPFYVDGSIDPVGLVTPNQVERFSVIPIREGCSLEIEFIITSVRIEDEGMYVVEKIYYGASLNSVFIKRQVKVNIPPGPVACFFTKSEFSETVHELHCHAKPGNGNTTLTCFQNGGRIPYQHKEAVVDRRIFWLFTNKPVSCCSHELTESNEITVKSCDQFKWPPITSKTTSLAPPTLLTFPITERSDIEYIESETIKSGCTHDRSKFWHSVIPVVLALMGCNMGY